MTLFQLINRLPSRILDRVYVQTMRSDRPWISAIREDIEDILVGRGYGDFAC